MREVCSQAAGRSRLKSINVSVIAPAACLRAVNAQEIILPDVMHDGPATMAASDRAAAEILDLSEEFRLCAVVHAADDQQWHHCYNHFVTRGYVGAIALPASRSGQPSEQLSKNRVAAPRPPTRHSRSGGPAHARLAHREERQALQLAAPHRRSPGR
jgi:hypothetical protein